jgi:DNA-binding SARP family transcriptional activator
MLALSPGMVVSSAELIDELWGRDPPANARNALQAHIVRLRKILRSRLGAASASELLQTSSSGYSMHVAEESVDVNRFMAIIISATKARTTNLEKSAELLCQALNLWRGPALLDVGEGMLCRVAAVRLDEMRLVAQGDNVDVKILLGQHGAVVPELEQMVARYPLRESFWEQLMVALYRSGRQTDALDAYQRIRQHLDTDLGLTPGPSLRSRFNEILNHDPILAAPSVPDLHILDVVCRQQAHAIN